MAKLNLIISDLRRRIITAGFQPGDKIPTQKELARELGVSVVTIGQAMLHLQEEGFVAATRGKGTVLSKRSLPVERKRAYGLLITAEDVHDPVLAFPVKALQNACAQHDHQLHILPCGHSRVTRAQLKIWAKDVDACFVVGTAQPDFVQAIRTLGKPVIFHGEFYREPCPPWAGQYTVDVDALAMTSLQFLVNMGHQNILLLRSGGSCYLESLGTCFTSAAKYLKIDKGFRQHNISLKSDGSELLELLRNEYRNVTALIVDGGMRASRILHTLGENGIRVPEDLSLFALNGVEPQWLITPHLSRVEPMSWGLGDKLLEMANAMIEGDIVLRKYAVPNLHWGKTCHPLGAPTSPSAEKDRYTQRSLVQNP